jgi:hypothetical protein
MATESTESKIWFDMVDSGDVNDKSAEQQLC